MLNSDDIGTGAGGGIIGTVLAWLGFKSRINSIEKKIEAISKSVVYMDVFREFEKRYIESCNNIYDRLEKIDNKLERLTNRKCKD